MCRAAWNCSARTRIVVARSTAAGAIIAQSRLWSASPPRRQRYVGPTSSSPNSLMTSKGTISAAPTSAIAATTRNEFARKPFGRWLIDRWHRGRSLYEKLRNVVDADVYKGASRNFLDDLERPLQRPGPTARSGGYIAKGLIIAGSGVLVIVAASRSEPNKATGLDGALKTLGDRPYGAALLIAAGLGISPTGSTASPWPDTPKCKSPWRTRVPAVPSRSRRCR